MATFKSKIVLIYDRSADRFVEKSDTIESLWWDQELVFVRYKNFNREYSYRPQYVFVLSFRGSIDPKIHDISIDGVQVFDITDIGSYGSHYGIIRKGRAPDYVSAARVHIVRSVGKSILEYLKEVATYIKDEESEGDEQVDRQSFLGRQIGNIIQSDGCVLTGYLNRSPVRTNATTETLIYPFDVNTSQKEAIRKALGHNISIIQGPPGTGKTQSILNLVANLVGWSKSVGIVSNNNSAIENVKHKLEKAGYGFLIAHLGNNENKKRFFESLSADFKPDPVWRQDAKTIETGTKKLTRIDEQINTLLREKEELARLREILPRLRHEQNLLHSSFEVYELPAQYAKLNGWDSEKLGAFKTVLEYFPERGTWFAGWSFRLKYGKVFSSARRARGANLLLSLDSLIYDKKIAETEARTLQLERSLERSDLKELLRTCSELSSVLFNHALYERYARQKEQNFTTDNYKDRFSEFVERFPVILSTTHSILNSVSEPLDYIIIDESSQVDIITASLAFSACRNVVIVGDEQQLPHIVTDAVKEKANELLEPFFGFCYYCGGRLVIEDYQIVFCTRTTNIENLSSSIFDVFFIKSIFK